MRSTLSSGAAFGFRTVASAPVQLIQPVEQLLEVGPPAESFRSAGRSASQLALLAIRPGCAAPRRSTTAIRFALDLAPDACRLVCVDLGPSAMAYASRWKFRDVLEVLCPSPRSSPRSARRVDQRSSLASSSRPAVRRAFRYSNNNPRPGVYQIAALSGLSCVFAVEHSRPPGAGAARAFSVSSSFLRQPGHV